MQKTLHISGGRKWIRWTRIKSDPTGVVMMYGLMDSSENIDFFSWTYSFFNPIPFGYATLFHRLSPS